MICPLEWPLLYISKWQLTWNLRIQLCLFFSCQIFSTKRKCFKSCHSAWWHKNIQFSFWLNQISSMWYRLCQCFESKNDTNKNCHMCSTKELANPTNMNLKKITIMGSNWKRELLSRLVKWKKQNSFAMNVSWNLMN